jgi:hypothetical protein
MVINNWRSAHAYPLLNFRLNLQQKLKAVCPNALTAQRIKRMESIRAKLTRGHMQLSQMQDIGGCRAIVNSTEQVRRLVASYKRSKFAHQFRSEKNYLEEPKPDGYRSHHLIYQYKALPNQNSDYDKLRIEIQLRTLRQHAWATAVEAVGIFTKQALKANIGSQEWLRLFALMGCEIADLEHGSLVPGTPTDAAERAEEIYDLSTRLHAVQTLNAYRATLNHVVMTPQSKGSRYYLVEYDYKTNQVFVWDFKAHQSQQANEFYTEQERQYSEMERNVVLVSVDSIQQLRRAYPNYFLDTENFTRMLSDVVAREASCVSESTF